MQRYNSLSAGVMATKFGQQDCLDTPNQVSANLKDTDDFMSLGSRDYQKVL